MVVVLGEYCREYDNPVKGLDQFFLSLCVSASRLYKSRPLYLWKYVEATEEKQELHLHPLSVSYLQHTFLLPTFYTYPRRSILCLHPLSPVTFLLPSPCFSGMINWHFVCMVYGTSKIVSWMSAAFWQSVLSWSLRRTSGVHFTSAVIMQTISSKWS